MTAGATAAGTLLVHGCSSSKTTSTGSSAPSAAPAASVTVADTPETTQATLGFMALTLMKPCFWPIAS
ncbi:MAG: hypothetical protein ACUVQO_03550 [Leptodesmis sp.]